MPIDLEAGFLAVWKMQFPQLPLPICDKVKPIEGRKFRFDFAWPEYMLAVEIEGGAGTGGRHTRKRGFQSDCEKYNHALLNGWRVLRFTGSDIVSQPVQCVELTAKVLKRFGKA